MTKELTTTQAGGLPSYLAGYEGPTGAEGIGAEDVSIPRIKLAQSLTPQVKDGELVDGSLFINVTGEVLAEPGEKVTFVLLAQTKEYILWNPDPAKRGEILARAFPERQPDGLVRYVWDKPNQVFDVKVGGKVKVQWETLSFVDEADDNGIALSDWGSEIPGDKESGIAATAHYNYLVNLPENDGAVSALSLSRSAVKRAKDFNAMLKLSKTPIFARVFTVEASSEKSAEGAYFNYKFKPAGFVTDEADFNKYKEMASYFAATKFTVDQSGEVEEKDERA